jgi:HEAT repeat protein
MCLNLPSVFAGALGVLLLSSVPALAQLPSKGTETEQQTVARCLADAKSPDDQVRLRAIMVLGKYDTMTTRQALSDALSDSSPRIRHSAAVALSEKRSLSSTISQAMLRRLDDPDVHVRRVVSSHLPYLLMSRGRTISYTIVNGQLVAQPSGGSDGFPQDVTAKLKGSFADEDAVVRKNMIDNYNYLRTTVPAAALLPLLRDEDRDVRSLAIDTIRRTMAISTLIKQIAHLVDDPDPTIRKRVAEILADGNTNEALELLRKLSKDKDFSVSTEALYGLFSKRHREARDTLLGRLDDPRMQESVAARVITSMDPKDDVDKAALYEFLSHRRTSYRQNAIMTLLRHRHALSDQLLFKCLSDSSNRVRQSALSLARLHQGIAPEFAKKLAGSPHVDVRSMLPSVIRKYSNEQAAPIIEELLFDEVVEVRISAVSDLVTRGVEDWEDTLETVLDAEDVQFCYALLRRIVPMRNTRINETLKKISGKLPEEKSRIVQSTLQRYNLNRGQHQIFRSTTE